MLELSLGPCGPSDHGVALQGFSSTTLNDSGSLLSPLSTTILGQHPLTVSLEMWGSICTQNWQGKPITPISLHQRGQEQPARNSGTLRTHHSFPPQPPWPRGCYRDTRKTHFRTQIHKFLICEKYKMKPCTSYVQTLFTRQESYHWLLQMTKLDRSFQSTSIYSLLQFLLGHCN